MNSKKTDLKTKGIRAVFILEIIGRPKEHLVQTLDKLIEAMNKEKGVKVIGKKIKDPVGLKNNKDFYTTFAEVEIEVEGILQIALLMFKYMPANIEIIEPELIALSNNGFNEIFNELARRLHAYDEMARILQIQTAKLQKDLKEPFKGKTYVFEWEEKHDSIEDHLDFYINGTKGEYRGIIGFGGIDSGRPQVKGNIFTNNTNGAEIVQAYKPGKWYNVKLEVMIDKQKYNIYVDGTKKISEAKLKTTLDAIVGFGLERQSSAKTPKGVKVRKFKEKGLP